MRLDQTLSGKKDKKTPIWLMRQAGRYLPEYRDLRATEPDFISYCLNSVKAAEATMQPIKRFDMDAAIIFSDILMVPWAMGVDVRFIEGEGPKLKALSNLNLNNLKKTTLNKDITAVFEAIKLTRSKLAADKNLIGFCGAPWTVATYMIEGGSSRDFERSRSLLWNETDKLVALLDRLVLESVDYLTAQAKAGADVLMIFDSWASAVPSYFIDSVVINPTHSIIEGLRAQGITSPVIGFPKGIGENIITYTEKSGVSAIGLDHSIDPHWAHANLPKNVALQGNLDPMALIEGGKQMLAATDKILDAFASRPHIFNLGHGINQHTPISHVETLINHIRKV